jgi:hypothetical protein
MAVQRVFHWKHGWIPLDHYAAIEKDHGRESTAKMQARVPSADLIKSIQDNGGFSYSPSTGRLLEVGKDKGFAVAVPGTETSVGREQVVNGKSTTISPEDFQKGVAAVIKAHKAEFAQGAVLGGWYSPERNEYMVEVTHILPAEDRAGAIKEGQKRNQEAIFDLATGETISTGGIGDAVPLEMPSTMPKLLSTFIAQPTPEERSAAKFYTGPGYTPLNGPLRRGETLPLPMQHYERKLDALLAKSVVQHDTTVYRGVQSGSWLPENLPPGAIIEDQGYVSTAANPDSKYPADVHMVIRVPKGTHALDLNGHKLTHHSEEAELLLPRGTKLRVVSDVRQPGGTRIIQAEVAP